MLIDQIKLIEGKQRSVAVEDEEKQQKYAAILTQANAMLNSVKHTIVQLQIAKVNTYDVKYIYVLILKIYISNIISYNKYNIFRIQLYL